MVRVMEKGKGNQMLKERKKADTMGLATSMDIASIWMAL